MPKKTLDILDKNIIRLLTEDGRISVGSLAERLNVTPPTVRSRMKSLKKSGMLKVAGLVDPFRHQELTTALIGLNILSYGKLDEILEKLASLHNVTWVAVVTGRYDVVAEVIVKGGMAELYKLTTDIIPQVGNVIKSETFVIMKSKGKWLCLPEGLEGWQR